MDAENRLTVWCGLSILEIVPADAQLSDSGSQGTDFQITPTPVRQHSILPCLGIIPSSMRPTTSSGYLITS